MTPAWSPAAIIDLASLRAYIDQEDPTASQRVVSQITRSVGVLLAENPHLGKPGRVAGTREFVIPKTPFIVPYSVHGNSLQILRVFHAARRWPEGF